MNNGNNNNDNDNNDNRPKTLTNDGDAVFLYIIEKIITTIIIK